MNRMLTTFFGAALLAATIAAVPPAVQPPGGPQPQPGGPPQPAYAPTPAPTADPAMLARAKNWFAQLQAGKLDRSQLSTTANAALTDAKIATVSQAIASLGAPTSFAQTNAGQQGNVSYAMYLLTFGNGTKLNFFFAVDSQGKVEGLQIGQPQ
jgi:hypothetical protein